MGEAARTWFADSEASGLGDRDYTAVLATIVRPRRERSPADVTNNVALERERAVAYDGLIVDLDGVVWLGGDAIEGAVEAVATMRALGTRIIFLTNDPQRSREEHAARLTAIGIPATAADLMTSSAATARFLAAHGDLRGRAAFVIGSPAFRDEIAAAHFEVVSSSEAQRADPVVVAAASGSTSPSCARRRGRSPTARSCSRPDATPSSRSATAPSQPPARSSPPSRPPPASPRP